MPAASDASAPKLPRDSHRCGLPPVAMEFAHDAKRRLFERANFWRASSALRCCILWHRGYQGRGATHSWDELKAASIKGEVAGDVPCEEWGQERANFGTLSALDRQQPRHLALRCRSRGCCQRDRAHERLWHGDTSCAC